MKEVQNFRKTFHITAFLILIWYFLFGASGAMYFGPAAQGIILFVYDNSLQFVYALAFLYSLVALPVSNLRAYS